MNYSGRNLPKLIAFDLDGTIWTPDMYQLWGGGSPFQLSENGVDLLDCSGATVKLLGISSQILDYLHSNQHFQRNETKVAWVSYTDEPDWAEECLNKFQTDSKVSFATVAHSVQIFKADKKQHFRNLKQEFPDIDFADMLFFDNERSNIASVKKLGVKCVYAPNGMIKDSWIEGLNMFN